MIKIFCTLLGLCGATSTFAAVISGSVMDVHGNGVAGVPVTDGFTIVTTDSEGRYSFNSNKKSGLVYISTPSGYQPAKSKLNIPLYWNLVTSPADEDEVSNFVLEPVDDSRFSFIAFADNQISNRHGEVTCFTTTTVPDINASLDSLKIKGYEPFLVALGDQAHDCYWKKNRYGLPEAYSDLAKLNAPLYSVMGNHDNDNTAMNDYDAAGEWRRNIGPNYYSFNKGGIHFVVLDNIEVVDDSPLKSKDGECVYKHRISKDQLEWLRKDLSFVADRSKPLVIMMHAPLYFAPGNDRIYYIENAPELIEILDGFEDIRVLSGHTHYSYATASEDGRIYENNYGAVCGSWWLPARIELGNQNNLCRDGTPSGYAVWTWDGSRFSNYFKGTGFDSEVQFWAYDLNSVEFDNDAVAAEFAMGRKKENEVMVNVWGYGPGWTVEMFEKGKPLKVERVRTKDPNYLLSGPIPYLEQGRKLVGTVRPIFTMHAFKAKAKGAKSPVEIRVTDSEGRVYTKTLNRPQPLTTDL